MSDDKDNNNQQWKTACEQLRQAFSGWAELSLGHPDISSDEKRRREMKELLKSLQAQIEELSENPTK